MPYSRGSQAKPSLHFCQECNNLLYPKADSQRRIIVYSCRICPYTEIVTTDDLLVYRNDLLRVTQCAFVPVNDDSFLLTIHQENKLELRTTLEQMLLWYVTSFTDMINLMLFNFKAHSNIPCPQCVHDE